MSGTITGRDTTVNIMTKKEIISLITLAFAIVALIVTLRLDYGKNRDWMMILTVGAILLAANPKIFGKKKRVQPVVEDWEETEEDECGYIDLESASPVEKAVLDFSNAFLTFQDNLSEAYYFIHYIDGKANETYEREVIFLNKIDYDELSDSYQTIENLFKAEESKEINDLCTISAEDFESVRKRYEDRQTPRIQMVDADDDQPEPVNRVGKIVSLLIMAFCVLFFIGIVILFPIIVGINSGNIVAYIFFCSATLFIIWASFKGKKAE